jgi:hypothetical protein
MRSFGVRYNRPPDFLITPALTLVAAALIGALIPAWTAVRAAPVTLLGSNDT